MNYNLILYKIINTIRNEGVFCHFLRQNELMQYKTQGKKTNLHFCWDKNIHKKNTRNPIVREFNIILYYIVKSSSSSVVVGRENKVRQGVFLYP